MAAALAATSRRSTSRSSTGDFTHFTHITPQCRYNTQYRAASHSAEGQTSTSRRSFENLSLLTSCPPPATPFLKPINRNPSWDDLDQSLIDLDRPLEDQAIGGNVFNLPIVRDAHHRLHASHSVHHAHEGKTASSPRNHVDTNTTPTSLHERATSSRVPSRSWTSHHLTPLAERQDIDTRHTEPSPSTITRKDSSTTQPGSCTTATPITTPLTTAPASTTAPATSYTTPIDSASAEHVHLPPLSHASTPTSRHHRHRPHELAEPLQFTARDTVALDRLYKKQLSSSSSSASASSLVPLRTSSLGGTIESDALLVPACEDRGRRHG